MMSSDIVLDSSAILAVLLNEPGQERVTGFQGKTHVSTVNMAEVRSRLHDIGLPRGEIDHHVAMLGVNEVDFSSHHAVSAGELRHSTRKAGLSLGDRACLALAMALAAPVMTADRNWANVDVPVTVEVIR